jgi:Holliday junction DNA helicase RuvA
VLVRAPGIGRKTAQRVILELKGRLAPQSDGARPAAIHANRDLIPVLMGLGYSAAEASEALQNVTVEEASSDEDRLRAALRHFSTP